MKVKLFISTLILWIVNILVYYLFNYPEHFTLTDILTQHVEWKELLLIYGVLFLVAIFFSLIFYKKISFSRKLIRSMILINVLCTFLMLANGLYRFYNNRQELKESVLSFQNEAKEDIKKDKIKEFGGGLLLPPKNKIEYKKFVKVDSIKKNYGLIPVSYCTISESLEISKEEYRKISEPYLEKRNGKNWREKMRQEIESIK
jgi:glucan phosphoethanolaminetransferase (alkaline phosphatase superfamily)